MQNEGGIGRDQKNALGLSRSDYKGLPSTLCKGCGHNAISSQIVAACYELGIPPDRIVKFSGIGCSSKSIAYFLDRSFGFNGLHGRMPSLATGALFADPSLRGLAVSGDGDTASIGLGQFKHLVRRNPRMLYIIEDNGVYGLTKGQLSPTSEKGLRLRRQGINPYMPLDLGLEALASGGSFVARSFAGDPKQVKELIKAGLSHRGLAVIDIVSPCVSFRNEPDTTYSYAGGKEREHPLDQVELIRGTAQAISARDEPGALREVSLPDGSTLILKNLDADYDPTDRQMAFKALEEANQNGWLLTGLIYIDPQQPTLLDSYDLIDTPLNRLTEDRLRPSPEALAEINRSFS
jgi:2-oxoglutarate ferredoxin oxidoreductase subunit beta